MKTTFRMTALAALLGMATMTAEAGVLTTDGVTFTSSWSGNVLTLEIDAANRSGGWSAATGLAALAIKGVGTYTSVSVSSSLGGTTNWTVSKAELNASGCAGAGKASTGNRLCFSGQQIALSDDMVFKFTFNGTGVTTAEPHVKVEFVDAKGSKVGSLLSQTLPAGTTTAATSGTTVPVSSTSTTNTATAAATGTVDTAQGGTLGVAAPATLPPPQSLPTTLPVAMTDPVQATGGGANAAGTAVPEPDSIALLLGGLGLMGFALRRRSR